MLKILFHRHLLSLTFAGLIATCPLSAAVYRPGPNTALGALPGSGSVLNLQTAIQNANSTPDDDTIDLGGLVYTIELGNATFTNPDNLSSGLPVIGSAAASGKLSLINGAIKRDQEATAFRFIYTQGSNLSLYNIKLINGYINGIVGASTLLPQGGALYNDVNSTLSIENCTFADNTADYSDGAGFRQGEGGSIYNAGVITSIQTSSFFNTTATTDAPNSNVGGAIYNNGGIIEFHNNTISGHVARWYGGGIYNAGSLIFVSDSTISNNYAVNSDGGGVYNNEFILSIRNTTLYANQTNANGGALYNGGTIVEFNNNTVSQNLVFGGGSSGEGIYNNLGAAIDNLFSNIFASNSIHPGRQDLAGTGAWPVAGNSGYNLIYSYAGSFAPNSSDITGVLANLGPLQNNGGHTFTAALLYPNEAINAGFNAGLNPDPTAPLYYDQRGNPYVRVACGAPDIGAYEAQACSAQ